MWLNNHQCGHKEGEKFPICWGDNHQRKSSHRKNSDIFKESFSTPGEITHMLNLKSCYTNLLQTRACSSIGWNTSIGSNILLCKIYCKLKVILIYFGGCQGGSMSLNQCNRKSNYYVGNLLSENLSSLLKSVSQNIAIKPSFRRTTITQTRSSGSDISSENTDHSYFLKVNWNH